MFEVAGLLMGARLFCRKSRGVSPPSAGAHAAQNQKNLAQIVVLFVLFAIILPDQGSA